MSGQIPLNRRTAPRDGADFFPTPPWATRALCKFLAARGLELGGKSVWEPACGEGDMARPLGEHFGAVFTSDLHDRRASFPAQNLIADFLLSEAWTPDAAPGRFDWIITNPPFTIANDFCALALDRARLGVAVFVKQQFLAGVTRHRALYSRRWPMWVLQFSERVPIVSGRVDPEAGTNQDYCWIIWITDPDLRARLSGGAPGCRLHWIAPCRKQLERPEDYPAPDGALDPAPVAPLFRANNGASPEEL